MLNIDKEKVNAGVDGKKESEIHKESSFEWKESMLDEFLWIEDKGLKVELKLEGSSLWWSVLVAIRGGLVTRRPGFPGPIDIISEIYICYYN